MRDRTPSAEHGAGATNPPRRAANLEIERRFLARADETLLARAVPMKLRQGYLTVRDLTTVRIRQEGEAWVLAVKADATGFTRHEIEVAVPEDDGRALLALAAGGIALTFAETATRQVDPGPLVLIHRRALLPSLGLFSGVTGMAAFLAFLALYARDIGMSGAGSVLLLFGLIVVATRVLFAKLPDRVPPFRLAAAALAMIGVGLAVAGLVQSVPGLYLGTVLTALGVAFTTPAFFAAIIARTAPSERGVALGTTSLFLDLAFGGGPVLAGLVAAVGGIPAGFVAAGLVAIVGAFFTAYAAFGESRLTTAELGADRP